MQARTGDLEVRYSARGIPSYQIEVWHDGLKKHRLIKGESEYIVSQKARLQAEEWNDRWAEVSARAQQQTKRAEGKRLQDEKKSSAAERTAAAVAEQDQLGSLLKATLERDDKVDWEQLKDKRPYPVPEPPQPALPPEPGPYSEGLKPELTDARYLPQLGLLDKLIRSRKEKAIAEKKQLFESDLSAWREAEERRKAAHAKAVAAWEETVNSLRKQHTKNLVKWQNAKEEYLAKQADGHKTIDAKRKAYKAKKPDAIIEYCDLVLSQSTYPDYFPKEFELEYDEGSQTLIVSYQLPCPDAIPTLKAVRYVAARDEFDESYISESQHSKLYDDVLYQVALRTLHELFEADTASALESIVFNGIVTAVDRKTGKNVTACVLSLRANKAEFMEINLAQVEPRACFKALKGVGSAKLIGLSPVPPIMQMSREDSRFVSAYEVADKLDGSVNLAAMDWEDFEHLIRELFEKEFSSTGGEVKVTQASRDGGVDAIAFDPDPIRGGKIVIQAKRYTATVGVSAVRDLYGTVVNEGATKGVLVTTSDYGADSYAFANGKPLVLLNGGHLLHMLAKHGHKARINISEARTALRQQDGR